MINYYSPLPLEISNTQKFIYTSDMVVRNIGYIPVIGATVGLSRVMLGIFQTAIADGSPQLNWSLATLPQVTYQGSKLAADGEANIIRGLIECLPLINTMILPIWDAECPDRYFLFSSKRVNSSLDNQIETQLIV